MRRRQLEALLGALRDDQELDRRAVVADALAVLGDEQRALRRARLANQREGLLRLLQLLEVEPHERLEVGGALVRDGGLLEAPFGLLGLGKLAVQLVARDALH